jgi:hypothetical protein
MRLTTDTHVLIELTSWEACLLKDLLNKAAQAPESLSQEQERLRLDLLYGMPAEK